MRINTYATLALISVWLLWARRKLLSVMEFSFTTIDLLRLRRMIQLNDSTVNTSTHLNVFGTVLILMVTSVYTFSRINLFTIWKCFFTNLVWFPDTRNRLGGGCETVIKRDAPEIETPIAQLILGHADPRFMGQQLRTGFCHNIR